MVQSTRTDSIPSTASTASTSGLTGTHPQGAKITGTSHLDDHSGPGPEVMSANTLEGNNVINPRGETLGEIEEIMLDVRSGRIAYAVLGAGGFLGIGEKYFAIPWGELTLDTDNKCFILDADKEHHD